MRKDDEYVGMHSISKLEDITTNLIQSRRGKLVTLLPACVLGVVDTSNFARRCF